HKAGHRGRANHDIVGNRFAHALRRPTIFGPCGKAPLASRGVWVVFCHNRLIEGSACFSHVLKHLGPMIFWSIAIAVTAIACAALFYAARGRTVNVAGPELAP